MKNDDIYSLLPKKEVLQLEKQRNRLEKSLGGIKNMDKLPGAIFVIDLKKERIAVSEARKLGIPSVGIVDTNCDPDEVDYIIPGNDDAIRAIRLFSSRIADAAIEGRQIYEKALQEEQPEEEMEPQEGEPVEAPPVKENLPMETAEEATTVDSPSEQKEEPGEG
jgi:small subunit ribosomal protein S2